MADNRANLLTESQKSYLRLVHEGLTSKEIAQRLGGSHHTVNSQIAVAVRILGARNRLDAASLIVRADSSASYDQSYDPQPIAEAPPPRALAEPREQPPHDDGFPLPVPTSERPQNKLTAVQRIVWILALAAIIALIVGGLISGITAQLEGLGRRV